MSLKSFAAKIFAKRIVSKTKRWAQQPIQTQERVFQSLIKQAAETKFGQDHNFDAIHSHADFVDRVPIRDYEGLRSYVERIIAGESDVLWPGRPEYFGKTSGTTSGAKYIPITKESIKYQVNASRDAILTYISETGNADFVDGKMIFLQGSPVLGDKGGIKTGRLSGISAHYVPGYLQKNRLPSWETNCIEDWETKVDAIIAETEGENMTVIAGIPSWVQMYFEKLNSKHNTKVGELFSNFQLFIYGGVNYAPYRSKFEELIGRKVDSIELFPASEGFFAYQNEQDDTGMLLLLDSGIFYEFVPADEFYTEAPRRLLLNDVEKDKDYVMIISTNAGLWGYNLGDTIRFISLNPFKVIVSGRIKHFISAFGEHVIAKEVEEAIKTGINQTDAVVNEFSVAPQINPAKEELPYHEWLIEFERIPEDLEQFANVLDKSLQEQNSYYFDLIDGKILQRLKITPIQKGGFSDYMKSIGKLGGQHKVQRLSNDRKLADALQAFKLSD